MKLITIKKNVAIYHDILRAFTIVIENFNSKLVFILTVYKKNITNEINLHFDLWRSQALFQLLGTIKSLVSIS